MVDEATKQLLLLKARARLRLQQQKSGGVAGGPVNKGVDTTADVLGGLDTGVTRGLIGIPGLPGSVVEAPMQLGAWIGRNFLGNNLSPEQVHQMNPLREYLPTAGDYIADYEKRRAEQGGPPLHQPITPEGKLAERAGEFGSTAIVGGPRAIVGGITGGLASETAGQLTEGTKWEGPARVVGGIVGGFGPSILRRAVTPRNIPKVNAEMAKTLRKEGIKLTEGQVTQRKGIQAAERKAEGYFYDATSKQEEQLEALTQSRLATAGIIAKRGHPDEVDAGFTRNGQRFDDLASRNSMRFDQQMGNDITGKIDEYLSLGPPAEKVTAYRRFLDRVAGVMDAQGNISGEAYKSIRSDLERTARASADPDYAIALRDLKGVLDDTMERGLAASGSKDLGAWRDVRRQYRNLLLVEQALGTRTPEAARGLITPPALRAANERIFGKRSMVRGKSEHEEISRAATGLMTPLPLTGAAPVSSATIWNSGLMFWADALRKAGRGTRMSEPIQRYLTNRLTPPPGPGAAPSFVAPGISGTVAGGQVLRDRNGIPVLSPNGQYLPGR